MVVEIRRGSARFTERVPGRLTRHAFSFGPHYDPDRLAWGPMVCHDDHLLGRGEGFDRHRHTDLVIVTTVLDGALRHSGPDGDQVLQAGDVGVLRTGGGDGVEHAEHATDDGRCRFVQVWLRPEPGSVSPDPGYDVLRQPDEVQLPEGTLVVRSAAAHDVVRLPAGVRHHLFVATGALLRSSLAEPLAAGDTLLTGGESDEPLEPGVPDEPDERSHEVVVAVPSTLLEWRFPT